MRVVKVLNNSLVLALDDDGQEIILMGKGIGFNKSIGCRLKREDIEKVFVLKDRDVSKNIIRLAADTDSVFFELAKNVVDYAMERHGMELMEHIYLSLTDHLAFAVKRVKDGIVIQNFYTLDMKNFNPKEFEVGEYALRLVQERLSLRLPADEAGNIAFHFINAQYGHPYNAQNRRIVQTATDILELVKYNYGIIYDEESTAYARYVTHVRLFAQRLVSGQLLADENSSLLYEQIASVCTSEFDCVDKIEIYTRETFHMPLTSQEKMYLALHIHRVLEEGERAAAGAVETE